MALNLMTPRYVAPDVTKAPLAGEAIRSSQASTNLAAQAQATRDRAQQAQEQQFGAQLGLSAKEQAEASAARRGNLALGWERADQGWEELGLRAEAQSVNLANTEQQMRHREDRLPFEIDALALANEAQDLKNELDYATMDDQIAKIKLGNSQTVAQTDALEASASATTQQTNFLEVNHERDQAQIAQFATYQKQIEEAVKRKDWPFVDNMVFPNVNPAQAQSLREMQAAVGKRDASIAAMAASDRQHTNSIARQAANFSIINKLPADQQVFWQTVGQIGTHAGVQTTWVDQNQVLTAEGHAALGALAEWQSLDLKDSDLNELFPPSLQTAGSGNRILGNTGHGGSTYLNGSMFVPTHEALQEAKALKAQQTATFQANINPTEFEYEKHGVKVKGKSIAAMDKESQQAHMDSVAGYWKKLMDTGEYSADGGHLRAWTKAKLWSKTDMGDITFVAPNDVAALRSVKPSKMYFDAEEQGFFTMPAAVPPSKAGPPTPTATAAADFDPLPKDYDGPQSDVYDKRKTINVELTSNGMPQDVASWAIEIGSRTEWLKDDWNPRDPLVGLVVQAERRTTEMAHLERREVADAGFGTDFLGASIVRPERFKDADIVELSKHLDKPFSQWPLFNGIKPYTIESASLLKKHIPEYLKLKRYEDELGTHMNLPVYKGQSKEY